MQNRLFRGLLVLLAVPILLTPGGPPVAAGDGHDHPVSSGDPRFEFLKSLAGTWTGPGLDETLPEGRFEFRVTAGGHAVEEREMIGTPMEMVTLYHMEGHDLVATHYCMLGNRPRLSAGRRVVDDTLEFHCNGKPGSAASHDEEHVHGWSMRLAEDGQLHYAAQLVKQGKVTEAPSLVLTRMKETASR